MLIVARESTARYGHRARENRDYSRSFASPNCHNRKAQTLFGDMSILDSLKERLTRPKQEDGTVTRPSYWGALIANGCCRGIGRMLWRTLTGGSGSGPVDGERQL